MKILHCLLFTYVIFGLSTFIKAEYIYYPDINLQYKFYKTPLTWYDGKVKCSKEDASLAMPKTQNEIYMLTSILNKECPIGNKYSEILSGFHGFFDEEEFVTLKGQSINQYFDKWRPPKQLSFEERCGSLNRSGNLVPLNCSIAKPFICQKEPVSQAVKRRKHNLGADYRCSEDIEKCYKVNELMESWNDARKMCMDQGANLVIIQNKAEEQFLVNLIEEYELDLPYVWVGIHDYFKVGEFTTVLDKNFSEIGYANWGMEEVYVPKRNKKLCVAFEISGFIYKYNFFCDEKKTFICEQPASGYEYYPEVKLKYKFYETPLTWYEGKMKCSKENASLAMPKNQKETDVLTKILNEAGIQYSEILLGFHGFFGEEFVTLNGQSLNYYWSQKSPEKRCGSLNRSGNFLPINCSIARPFICQRDTEPHIEQPKKDNFSPDFRCGEDIDKCFRINGYGEEWKDARKNCMLDGGNLAIITNKVEEQFVANLIKEYNMSQPYAWIGVHDYFQKGEFTTVLDKNFSDIGYANWAPNQLTVTDENKKRCVVLKDNGFLYSGSCDSNELYVCEKPALTSSDYKYYPEVGEEYKLFRKPLNWSDARYQCAKENASLAFPRNQKEIQVLLRIFSATLQDSILSGFHCIFGGREFITLKGEPIQNYYGEQRPLYNDLDLECGSLHRSGMLKEYNCSIASPFICQKNIVKNDNKMTSRDDSAYKCSIDKCYRIYSDQLNWHNARITCLQDDSNLVIIRNKAEEKFVVDMIKEQKYPWYGEMWTGVHNFFNKGNFTSVLDENFEDIGYANWREGQPSPINYNCVAIRGEGSIGMSHGLKKKLHFICERPKLSSMINSKETQPRQQHCPVPSYCPRCSLVASEECDCGSY